MRLWMEALSKDCRGATMVEFSIVLSLLLVLTGGIVDVGWAYFQWNSAAKAVQQGLRLAAVSDPLVGREAWDSVDWDGGANLGGPMPAFRRIICSGKAQSCDGEVTAPANFDTIIYGRGETDCGNISPGQLAGMCDIYRRIKRENVIVVYEYTGLGFAGRPGGPVPTITVKLCEDPPDGDGLDDEYGVPCEPLVFESFFLGALVRDFASRISVQPMKSTITGEDLASAPLW